MRRTSLFAVLGLLLIMAGCQSNSEDSQDEIDPIYRQYMRNFVQGISSYAKDFDSAFVVIPQNGQELLTANGEETGTPSTDYINAIDGVGREDLFYGYNADNQATPEVDKNYMLAFMDIAEAGGVEVLAIDYCSTPAFMDGSYAQNTARGYISFAADHRELDNIPSYPPEPFNVNAQDIHSLSEARNFLYIINSGAFASKDEFLDAVRATNYDAVIMDLYHEGTAFTAAEINSLKTKANFGSRLAICYMSIGEAEDYRYYWQGSWITNPPSWLAAENPDWPGNYKIRYWQADWQNIIYGSDNSYLYKIIDAGFDGVYLDIIDAFEYFE